MVRFIVGWLTLFWMAGCSALEYEPGKLSYGVALAVVLAFALIAALYNQPRE